MKVSKSESDPSYFRVRIWQSADSMDHLHTGITVFPTGGYMYWNAISTGHRWLNATGEDDK
jgi:hypothetical protein